MGKWIKVTSAGRITLPADVRRRHGLGHGGEVMIEDLGDTIVLRTVDEVVARTQAVAQRLVEGKQGASVDDFLADRRCESEREE